MIFRSINETTIELGIDSKLYSIEVVHKCFYWYAGVFSVEIKHELNTFYVTISKKESEWNIEKILHKIKSDLIDFKTREIINLETKNIREILTAKAFSNNHEFDQLPPGEINDPLGFDPSKI